MRPLRSPHAVAVATGYAFGAAALLMVLLKEKPPPWSISTSVAMWVGVPMAAFLLPTSLAITDGLLRGLCTRHLSGQPADVSVVTVYDAIMLRVMLFVTVLHAIILAGLQGWLFGRLWAARIVPLLLGLTLIAIGNLLPRTRPNLAIGIRTSRALSDRVLWMRIHRLAGYVVVALGAVVAVSALTLPSPLGPGMILLAGPIALGTTCYIVRRVTDDAPATPMRS